MTTLEMFTRLSAAGVGAELRHSAGLGFHRPEAVSVRDARLSDQVVRELMRVAALRWLRSLPHHPRSPSAALLTVSLIADKADAQLVEFVERITKHPSGPAGVMRDIAADSWLHQLVAPGELTA